MPTTEEMRQFWLERQYDSIMSNDPGKWVWNTLKAQVVSVSVQDLTSFWQAENEPS